MFVKFVLFVTVVFWATVAGAQDFECLPDADYPKATDTSPENPAQYITPCLCVNWDPVDFAHHYHVYVDGTLVGNENERAYYHCPLVKNEVHEITIFGVAGYRRDNEIPAAPPYFTEWADLSGAEVCVEWAPEECLDGNLIVPCP